MRTSSLLEKSAFIYLVTCMFFSTMNLFIVEVPSSIWELVLPIKIYLLILPVLFLSTLWIYRSRYSSQFRKLISAVFVAHVLGIYTDFYLLIFTDRPWLFFSNIYQCFVFAWDDPENWWSILFFVVPLIVALAPAIWLGGIICTWLELHIVCFCVKINQLRQGNHKDFALKFENDPSSMGLIEADTEDNTKTEKGSNPIGNNSGDKVGDKDRESEDRESAVHKKDDMKNNNSNKYIFEEHLTDLKNIEKMLHYTHILGVNAHWGDGKSFVMNEFCKKAENDKSFYTIRIELLSYRYNEFEKVLLHKLTGLLKYNHIFSIQLEEFRAVFGKNWWGRLIGAIFLGLTDEKQAIWGSMSTALSNLPRNVLIVYEDLERIDNIEYIKRILSISERLTGAAKTNVYVIYEYDKQALLSKEELKPDYLEKYIPHEVNLSHVSFSSMITQVIQGLKREETDWIKHGDWELLESTVSFLKDAQKWNSYLLALNSFNVESDMDSISTRKVIQFLQDITANIHLMVDELYSKEKDKKKRGNTEFQIEKQVIKGFWFVKHFMPDEYIKLKAKESTFRQPLFSVVESKGAGQEGENSDVHIENYYNIAHEIHDLYIKEKEALVQKAKKSISSSLENRRAYSMLLMFGYINVFYMGGKADEYDEAGNPLYSWFGMSIFMRRLYASERNAFIDQIIWHLLQNDITFKSELVRIFDFFKKYGMSIKDEKNEQIRNMKWKQLQSIMYGFQDCICPDTIYASNKPENIWAIIALGLLVLEGPENEWEALLESFKKLAGPETENFSPDAFIGFISFIDARYPNVYKNCVVLFNKIYGGKKSGGLNFVERRRLVNFAIRYIALLPSLVPQLLNKRKLAEIWYTFSEGNRLDNLEQQVIASLIKDIKNIQEETDGNSFEEELSIASEFLIILQNIFKKNNETQDSSKI